MTKRPNIILITSDAHRADCYGFEQPSIMTPHINHLASAGSRFSNCTTANILCQPARASILTGLYPTGNGVYDNGVDLSDDMASQGFAQRLSNDGYFTGFVGKAHFESRRTFVPTGSPGNLNYDCRYGDDWVGPYKGFQHAELAVNGHLLNPPAKAPIGQHYERWFYSDGRGDEKLRLHKAQLAPAADAPLTWSSGLPPVWHTSTWTADRAIRLIQSNPSDPKCLWVSFPDPHPPFDCPAPWCWSHDPADVELPKNRSLNMDNKPWWHAKAAEFPGRIYDDERVPDDKHAEGFVRLAPKSDEMLRHMLANYYGSIALFDHNVGRIISALNDAGELDNTYIIVTSDHGFMMGDHGWLLQNPLSYECLTRVAMVVSGPGVVAGQVIDEPVSSVDLCSTVFDLAGATASPSQDGQSLRPMIEGENESRDCSFVEWGLEAMRYCLGSDVEFRTVRTKTHKLTIDLISMDGELYDLVNDPGEMVNLYRDTGYTAVRKDLESLIRKHVRAEPAVSERVGYY